MGSPKGLNSHHGILATMKTATVLCVLVLGLAIANPSTHSRFILMADAEGNGHIVDVEATDANAKFDVNTDVIFNLYTRKNPTTAQVLYVGDNAGLAASNFNPSHPTRLNCHGWNSKIDTGISTGARDAFLTQGEFNVIVVDWTAGSNTINYKSARDRVPEVGHFVGSFVNYLIGASGISAQNIHFVGHSLGAHIVGIAGHDMKQVIHTVTGLDVALPLFSLSDTDRITPDSGDYVEIIHTHGGLLGFLGPIGTADFYPNGGRTQPGCVNDVTGACSHARSIDLFVESITADDGFWSWNCRDFDELMAGHCEVVNVMRKMGISDNGLTSNNGLASGIYHLITNEKPPFAQGRPPGWDHKNAYTNSASRP